ncbi:MAG: sulfotransferase family protein [Micromonosporaceae bacterium]
MSSDRPVFVMGFPRSGTTMLQLMLHSHPRISIPPETRFVLTGYWSRRRFGDLQERANRRALAEWIVKKKTFKDLGVDRDTVTQEIIDGPPTLGSAFGIVFRAYARRFGKPRWGDKRPAYLHNIHVVMDLFPNAQLVNIVRDGRDCIASLMEMTWNQRDIYRSIQAWNTGVDYSKEAARELGPDSYHELKYEQLVEEPEPVLKGLCEYLGEEFDPAMTEPAKVASVAVPDRKSWHGLTHQAVTSSRVNSWRQRLEPWQISLCEAAMGSRLQAMGYELSGAEPPELGHRLRYMAVAAKGPLLKPRRAASKVLNKVRSSAPTDCRIPPGDIANAPAAE